MRLPALLTSVHKWIGVVVGIQVLLWVAGGLVMSAFPIELVRGETSATVIELSAIGADEIQLDWAQALAAAGPANAIRTVRLLDRLHFQVERSGSPPVLIDARDGKITASIDEAIAREVARRDFLGGGRVRDAMLLTRGSSEYRGTLPVWRVRLADARNTAIYVSPVNGQVVARRNDVWRLYDFFWMLHIMDYRERIDFNHPLLVGASALALLLAASGFWLLFFRVRVRLRH